MPDRYRDPHHESKATKEDTPELRKWRPQKRGEWARDHVWTPNQLRHTAATTLRKEFRLQAAQVILGHKTLTVTQVYAEKNVEAAQDVMARVG